jgi:phosphatidylinositol 4-kinase
MKEMMALEEERMERTKEHREGGGVGYLRLTAGSALNSAEDESIIRKELNKVDPSALVFSESWASKKVREQ